MMTIFSHTINISSSPPHPHPHTSFIPSHPHPHTSFIPYHFLLTGLRLIHPNVSSLVAEKLGVKSLRLTLLSQNLEQNLFGGGAGPGESSGAGGRDNVEAFGQAESLCGRLKTILDLYPEGNPILSGTPPFNHPQTYS